MIYVGQGSPYAPGALQVQLHQIPAGLDGAPVAMEIHAPTDPAGRYAVVVFQHGFLMANRFYRQLAERIASHGFVVVAPQMYPADSIPIGKPTWQQEVATASANLAWIQTHLAEALALDLDPERLGLVGHSRGGKVAWGLLEADPAAALAVAGLDPVDGELGGGRLITGAFAFTGPSLIVGTGLGEVAGGPFSPACAPIGDNHAQFFAASAAPSWHVTATDHGHNDLLDDAPQGCFLVCDVCPGLERPGFRDLTGGLVVALMRAILQGDEAALDTLEDEANAPVNVLIERR